MATSKMVLILALLLPLILSTVNGQVIKPEFYKQSCPLAESITMNVVRETLSVAPSLSGPLLRMFFHDCFVRVSIVLLLRLYMLCSFHLILKIKKK